MKMTEPSRPADDDLLARLRRFEWACARGEHAREVFDTVRQRSHDLLNLVQIVDLVSQQLMLRYGAEARELAVDLHRAARDGRLAIDALVAIAHVTGPAPRATVTTPVAEVVRRVAGRATIIVDGDAAVAWTADELELLLAALQLDAPHGALVVRSRALEDGPVVEVLCAPIDDTALAVRVADALARDAGGDVTLEPRLAGGHELVVTLPVV
jgi:hypothetical protein